MLVAMEPAVTAMIGASPSRKEFSSGVGRQLEGVSQKAKPVVCTRAGQSGAGGWNTGEQARQTRQEESPPSQSCLWRGGRP